MTSYNHAHFLGEAVESALAQTVAAREIVVVDDGSTDDTAAVVARYPCVRYVRQGNQGLAAARNTGIREGTGSYLLFLDADDRLLPRAIEAGLNCFSVNPHCAFVYGLYRRFSAERTPMSHHGHPPIADHYLALLALNHVGMHATVLYRREILEVVGGFDTRLPACEDYDLYLRIARRYPVAAYDEVVAEYRIHDSNMSHNSGLMLSTVLLVLRRQDEHVRHDRHRRAALRQGIATYRTKYVHEVLAGLQAMGGVGVDAKTWCAVRLLGRHAPWQLLRFTLGSLARRSGRVARAMRPAVALMRLIANSRRPHGTPPVGRVGFGDLRRVTPISRYFGYDRGLPIDRHYIETFLARHAGEVHGRVLEVGDNDYTVRFGGDRVTTSDVLHVTSANRKATFVDDLASGRTLPSEAFDCVILIQTLHLIYDAGAALATVARILRPGGVLLMTVPGTISQIECGEWARTWYWGFTELTIRRLCEASMAGFTVDVEVHGNVLAAISFLEGLSAGELRPEELTFRDALYPLVITVRGRKPGPPGRNADGSATIAAAHGSLHAASESASARPNARQ